MSSKNSDRTRSRSKGKGDRDGIESEHVEDFSEDVPAFLDEILKDLTTAVHEEDVSHIKRCLFMIEVVKNDPAHADVIANQLSIHGSLMDRSQAIVQQWASAIKVNDHLEVYYELEDRWHLSKVIGLDGTSSSGLPLLRVHYLGFKDKYDESIDRFQRQINPFGTFLIKNSPKPDPTVLEKSAGSVTTEITAPSAKEEDAAVIGSTSSGRKVRRVFDTYTGVTLGDASVIRSKDDSDSLNKSVKSGSKKSKKDLVKSGDTGGVDHNDWNCALCGLLEAPRAHHSVVQDMTMALCDGPCLRSFHKVCLDPREKKLFESSSSQDVDSLWYCQECREGAHMCRACFSIGVDYLVRPITASIIAWVFLTHGGFMF